jgi:CRP-like cAMP-binding protein
MVKTIADLLREHPFFEGMEEGDLATIAGCGKIVTFAAGSYIAREGEDADLFYVIRRGKVAIETFIPQRPPLVLQTLPEGEIIGWSWLFPPYKWTFDARAMDEDVHAIALDGRCLRGKCERDTRMGFDLMQRFARIMTQRLQATRLQILDVYGVHGP